MNFPIKLNERNVDEARLLDNLREVAKQLGKNTVTSLEYDELGAFHSSTMLRRFGSRETLTKYPGRVPGSQRIGRSANV